jgi:hypothetical protein
LFYFYCLNYILIGIIKQFLFILWELPIKAKPSKSIMKVVLFSQEIYNMLKYMDIVWLMSTINIIAYASDAKKNKYNKKINRFN